MYRIAHTDQVANMCVFMFVYIHHFASSDNIQKNVFPIEYFLNRIA